MNKSDWLTGLLSLFILFALFACSSTSSHESLMPTPIRHYDASLYATPAPKELVIPTPTPTFSEHKIGAEEIPYEDLFRYNEKHIGKRVVFRARILQALEHSGSFEILAEVANPGKTSVVGTVSLIYIDAPVRLLEGDEIEFIATVVGLDTYQSVGAGPITVPQMLIEQSRFLE